MLRRVSGCRRGEATGVWRKLHIKELQEFNSLQDTIKIIKSKGWDGRYMWHAWERRNLHVGF
jgi:hypothetical protein